MEGIRKSKFLKIGVLIVLIVLAILYLRLFFTNGIDFEGTFLRKSEFDAETRYTGNSYDGEIRIIVKGDQSNSSEVIYQLPNQIQRHFIVQFNGSSIKIDDQSGNVLFKGTYDEDSPFLYDLNGEPNTENLIRVKVNNQSLFTEEYQVPLKHVADMALFANDSIRGNILFLFLALWLFTMTAIDYKYPHFFFKLRNFIDVKDPERSDFYIMMQKISWRVLPVIGGILLLVGLYV